MKDKKLGIGILALLMIFCMVGSVTAAAMAITIGTPTDDSTDVDGDFTWAITSDYNMTSATHVLVYQSGATRSTAMTVDSTNQAASLAEVDLPDGDYDWYVTTVNATNESTPGTSTTWDIKVKKKNYGGAILLIEEEQAVATAEAEGMSNGAKVVLLGLGYLVVAFFAGWPPFKKK